MHKSLLILLQLLVWPNSQKDGITVRRGCFHCFTLLCFWDECIWRVQGLKVSDRKGFAGNSTDLAKQRVLQVCSQEEIYFTIGSSAFRKWSCFSVKGFHFIQQLLGGNNWDSDRGHTLFSNWKKKIRYSNQKLWVLVSIVFCRDFPQLELMKHFADFAWYMQVTWSFLSNN